MTTPNGIVRYWLSLITCLFVLANTGLATQPFQDVTETIGLTGVGGGYAAWGDYNRDGWVDLTVDGQLWRNEQGQRFVRHENTAFAGSGVWGDVDNDGDLDFFALAGLLYRNLDGDSFEEVPGAIPEMPKSPMNATWADTNNDGLIDLYVTGYEGGGYHPDFLFQNQGDSTFEVILRGPATPGRGVTACDYDEDGDIDLYVSNYRLVPNALLQNDGNGVFNDVALAAKVDGDGGLGAWGHTIGSSWGDFDNDGHFDLFAGNFSHPPAYQDRPKFYRNLGKTADWLFEDRSAAAGLHWQESYASPTLGDFDNDGLLDLFFTTVYAGDQSVLYRNQGDWKFANATEASHLARPTTYQAAWADFNNDGFLDLLHGARLFKNPGGTHRWLKVLVSGVGAVNQTAFGTQVRIRQENTTLVRQVESATGQGNQNDLTLHFGLGTHAGPVDVDIRWPDGTDQQIQGVATNTLLRIQKE